jgi:hypothetical protein
VLELEHSLVSLSKWESKYQRPFLSNSKKTSEELFDYLWMMILTPNVDPKVMYRLSQENIDDIQEYIDSSQSATTFGELPGRKAPGEVITNELIYYWMVAYTIPFECQYWHLNRLFALVKICNIKNSKHGGKRMSRGELARRNADLNAKRRQELGTAG